MTQEIVPTADGSQDLGTDIKRWGAVKTLSVQLNGTDLQDTLDAKIGKLSWSQLVTQWTYAPEEQLYSGGDGEVFAYVYGSTTYYRFVPSVYSPDGDQFFTTFVDPDLIGLVATRGTEL